MVDDDRADEKEGEGANTPDPGSFHDRLPPPPDFNYSRPSLGKTTYTGSADKLTESSGSNQAGRPGVQSAGKTVAAGMALAGSLFGGLTLGLWLDSHYGKPGAYMWSAIMTVVGAVGGFMNLMRVMSPGGRDRRQK
jgi:hypothetical protein